MTNENTLHDWKAIDVGNTYSEYKFTHCKKVFLEDMEGPYAPKDGCTGVMPVDVIGTA